MTGRQGGKLCVSNEADFIPCHYPCLHSWPYEGLEKLKILFAAL